MSEIPGPESIRSIHFRTEDILTMSSEQWNELNGALTEEEFEEYAILLKQAVWASGAKVSPEIVLRPRHLYHASPQGSIEQFQPRAEKKRQPQDPPQIFATPSRAVATMFLVPTDDSFVISGSYDSGRTWTYIIGDEEEFRSRDIGGWIYTLPSQTFSVDPHLGLGLFEWTSREAVVPESKQPYPSGMQAMLDEKVSVYIVTQDMFATLRSGSVDHAEVLAGLVPVRNEEVSK